MIRASVMHTPPSSGLWAGLAVKRRVQLLHFLILGGLTLLLVNCSTQHPTSLLTSRHDLKAAGLGRDWNEEEQSSLDSPGNGGTQDGMRREKLRELGDKGKGLIQGKLLGWHRRRKQIEVEGLEFEWCIRALLAAYRGLVGRWWRVRLERAVGGV